MLFHQSGTIIPVHTECVIIADAANTLQQVKKIYMFGQNYFFKKLHEYIGAYCVCKCVIAWSPYTCIHHSGPGNESRQNEACRSRFAFQICFAILYPFSSQYNL